MANTMTLISSVTVGAGGASSIVFSSIPSTYTDLLIKVSARSTYASTTDSLGIYFNTVAADCNYKNLAGNGTSATSGGGTAQTDIYVGEFSAANSTTNTFGSCDIYIPNYTSSNQKTDSSDSAGENNATFGLVNLLGGLSTKTAAISTITVRSFGGSFNLAQYSTAYLYGIKNS
jgi:hypothetical protein